MKSRTNLLETILLSIAFVFAVSPGIAQEPAKPASSATPGSGDVPKIEFGNTRCPTACK